MFLEYQYIWLVVWNMTFIYTLMTFQKHLGMECHHPNWLSLTNSIIFQRGSSTTNQDFIFVDTTSGGPAIDLTNLPENVRYVHRDNTGVLES